MPSPRRPASFPARPAPNPRYRAPMAAQHFPKVHPWTPSRSRQSGPRTSLTREQAKALDEAREYIRRFDGMPGSLRHGAEFVDCLVLSPVLFGLLLAQRGVRALFRKIIRDAQRRETVPSPSLRGVPVKEDIDSVWAETPRTVLSALRLGSRLLDLEPTVDNSRVWKENPLTGKREVVFRHAGIKGWLQSHCPGVQYNTAMRYKKLASRLRTGCGVAGNIPFEWLLPDTAVPKDGLDAATLSSIERGRAELEKILAGAKSLRGLDRVVEERMNLAGLPRKGREISVISHDKASTGDAEVGTAEKAIGSGRETAPGRRRGRPKMERTVSAGAAEARRERMLSALRRAGMRAEGRLLWLHFRHLIARSAERKRSIPRDGYALPMLGKNA